MGCGGSKGNYAAGATRLEEVQVTAQHPATKPGAEIAAAAKEATIPSSAAAAATQGNQLGPDVNAEQKQHPVEQQQQQQTQQQQEPPSAAVVAPATGSSGVAKRHSAAFAAEKAYMEAAIKAMNEKPAAAEAIRKTPSDPIASAALAEKAAKERAAQEAARKAAQQRFAAEKRAMQQKIAAPGRPDEAAQRQFSSARTAMEAKLKALADKEREQKLAAQAKRELALARKQSLHVLVTAARRWRTRRTARRRRAAVVVQSHFRARFLSTRLRIGSYGTWLLIIDGCRAARMRAVWRLGLGQGLAQQRSQPKHEQPQAEQRAVREVDI
jgi:hypothetical protein